MGVQITELLPKKEAKLEDFGNKVVAVDAANHLYQFLTTIRSPDGSFFTDSHGNVTSHLIGLFTRTTHLMKLGIKPAYVFDGEMPKLKRLEMRRRAEAKEEAAEKYSAAEKKGDAEAMKKYAARSTRLTKEMIADAKEVIEALGLPVIQAPGEGEAQASHMVAKKDAYAIASQDADSLLFGATRLVRNLSIEGRRKQAGVLGYGKVEPELILLEEVLSSLGITQQQLICLAMLVGTDYNTGGIKGVGPKNALKMVKEHKTPENIFAAAEWSKHFSYPWQEVLELFEHPSQTDNYELKFHPVNTGKLSKILCEKHDFSGQRVEKQLEELGKSTAAKKQKGLGEFFA
ncbi:flap endonuclease-1 [Candidatus Woesearchaeota archaeon]|nr:flap endonuclease-1 [Candidatus Woesearchaeota archaeon]